MNLLTKIAVAGLIALMTALGAGATSGAAGPVMADGHICC